MKTRWMIAALAAATVLTPVAAAAQDAERAERPPHEERAREGRGWMRSAPDASARPEWAGRERGVPQQRGDADRAQRWRGGDVPPITQAPPPPQAQRERPGWTGGAWRDGSAARQNPGASPEARDWAAGRRDGRADWRSSQPVEAGRTGGAYAYRRGEDARRDERRGDDSSWRRDGRYGSYGTYGSNSAYRYGSRYGSGYEPSYGAAWSRDWRGDRRYDWQGYRQRYSNLYRMPRYYAPYSGWGYRRLSIGITLGSGFWGDRYAISDPWYYRLPQAYGPYRWVRYWDDALLIDLRTGRVVDVVYGIFW